MIMSMVGLVALVPGNETPIHLLMVLGTRRRDRPRRRRRDGSTKRKMKVERFTSRQESGDRSYLSHSIQRCVKKQVKLVSSEGIEPFHVVSNGIPLEREKHEREKEIRGIDTIDAHRCRKSDASLSSSAPPSFPFRFCPRSEWVLFLHLEPSQR